MYFNYKYDFNLIHINERFFLKAYFAIPFLSGRNTDEAYKSKIVYPAYIRNSWR